MSDTMAAAINPAKSIFRVQGVPAGATVSELEDILHGECPREELERLEKPLEMKATMCLSCYGGGTQTALVEFSYIPAYLSGGKYQLQMDGKVIDIDKDFYGFTPLYRTRPGTEIKADIIAVTGLAGHAFGSWRGRGSLRAMWLRDFLAEDFPDCRMVSYGYNSRLDDKNGTHTTLDYTRGLLEELRKIRTEKEAKRPIIFICHSFGGILVTQSLLKSKDKVDPVLNSLFPATYATVFFATPHRGMIVSDMLSALGEKSTRAPLIQSIQTNADALVDGYYRFINEASKLKLQIVSFYERQRNMLERDEKSKKLERTREESTVLENQSSLLNLPDTMERKIPVDKDHSEITKFDSKYDSTYTTLLTYMEKFRSGNEEHTENLHNCDTADCAIIHKNMSALRRMCDKKRVDVDAVQKDGTTLLHIAAGSGSEEAIELLLGQGANIEAADKDQNTALLLAAKSSHGGAVTCLLDYKANIEAKNSSDETALFLAAQGLHEEVVKTLLEKKADNDTALLLAATQRNEEVVNFLMKHEVGGSKALLLAAKDDNDEVVEFLLGHGADGGTALFLAANNKDESAMGLLLNYDIDKNKALFLAAKREHGPTVDLLLENGANKGQALLLAAKGGHKVAVKILLEKGADTEAENKSGETALCLAAQGLHKLVAKMLLDKGANKYTAIIMAARSGGQKAVSLLQEIG